MAAVSALRCEPGMQACYERLVAKGKDKKVALVAVMRKLAVLVNSLLRENRTWQLAAPSHTAIA